MAALEQSASELARGMAKNSPVGGANGVEGVSAAARESSDIWLNSDERPDSAELAAGSRTEAPVVSAVVNDDPKDDRTEASGCLEREEAGVGTRGRVSPTVMEAEAAAGAVADVFAPGSPGREMAELTEPHGTLKMMAVPLTTSDT